MRGPSPDLVEHDRVRGHLERALFAVESAGPRSPTRKVGARREALKRLLREYIDVGRYPINEVTAQATPIFVDDHGARCAVAALLAACWIMTQVVSCEIARQASDIERTKVWSGSGKYHWYYNPLGEKEKP